MSSKPTSFTVRRSWWSERRCNNVTMAASHKWASTKNYRLPESTVTEVGLTLRGFDLVCCKGPTKG